MTVFLGVPTMYMALLAVPDRERFDTSTLKLAASGGASLPVEVLRGVEQAFGLTLLEGYGLSETSPVASFNHPDRPTKPGSVGTPIRGVEFGLRDDDDNEVADGEIGEIVIRGENVMKGYWNQPDATAEAMRGGWFHSGDLARRDEDGFYFIVDRKKDMIIRNGFNVYPARGRGDPVRPSGGRRGSSLRSTGRDVRRGDRCVGDSQGRRRSDRGGIAQLREGADRGIQISADHPIRSNSEGSDRQDLEERDQVRALGSAAAGRRGGAKTRYWVASAAVALDGPSLTTSPATSTCPMMITGSTVRPTLTSVGWSPKLTTMTMSPRSSRSQPASSLDSARPSSKRGSVKSG